MSIQTTREDRGFLQGIGVAVVTQNTDPEGLGRVRVSIPWHHKPDESTWARLAMPMAGAGRGFLTIPEVGDEVLVIFDGEELGFPYVLGSLWNGKDKPPLSNDDGRNDKRIFRSRKEHHLLFDDGERGVVELAHEKGRRIVFDDTGFAVQDERGNEIKVDSTSGAMTIQATGQLNIKAASITIEATAALAIQAKGTLTVKGGFVLIN